MSIKKQSQNQLFNFLWEETFACVYREGFEHWNGYFKPVSCLPHTQTLIGLENELTLLMQNTLQFLNGNRACAALLWGARGCGKSSSLHIILSHILRLQNPALYKRLASKAILNQYINLKQDSRLPTSHNKDTKTKHIQTSNRSFLDEIILSFAPLERLMPLRVIELSKISLPLLPMVIDNVRELPFGFVVVCDDLCFLPQEQGYSALKTILEGSFEAKPHNVLFYATSNHRHLITESYPQDTLHLQDSYDEILSLSDRFGLVIGFYTLGAKEYLALIESYLNKPLDDNLSQNALNFATLKGSRNPRIANEFCTLYNNGII